MKEQAPKIPPQIVGNAGLFYVCHKLSALGWNAMPTSGNARGVDVMRFSLDGKRRLLLQVKSLSIAVGSVPAFHLDTHLCQFDPPQAVTNRIAHLHSYAAFGRTPLVLHASYR